MTNERTRRIDLRVPTGWNQCTAEQLEAVTGIILRRTQMQDRYHPYDAMEMKTEVFFALTETHPLPLPVMEGRDVTDGGEAAFMVEFIDRRPWWRRGLLWHSNKQQPPFPIAVWQVHSFIEQHLKWLDDFTGLLIFPYHDLGHYWARRWMMVPWRYRLGFDGELLDGMTWQQYRFANEWLNYYVDVNGLLAQATHRGQSPSNSSATAHTGDSPHESLAREALRARTEFLRAVYRLPDGHEPKALRKMSPERFQVILIWWQSMMAEMQRKYRRCFKSSSVNRKSSTVNSQLPIDLYTRSIATIQDKYHLTEEQINQQPCRVILQHLEDMAHEAEELEKISKQNKRK